MIDTQGKAGKIHDGEEILDKEELARFLKVEMKTVNHLLYSGQLPCFKCGRGYRFIKSQIEEWVVVRSRAKDWRESL